MLRMRKRKYAVKMYMAFLLCMVLIVGLFAVRVITGSEVTPMSDGQIILTSYHYELGRVMDRNHNRIVSGEGNGLSWSDESMKGAWESILGADIEATLNSRMTILGNCPWVFGTEDNRFTLSHLLHPDRARIGGDVCLTLDQPLQNHIYSLIQEEGYENAYVIVSDWSTGEIHAIYGNVLGDMLHPGSTLKPLIAASALTIDENWENYTYNCVPENHTFDTEDGPVRINCVNQASHGNMSMADAIAYSCNGYFISLIHQIDEEKLMDALQTWGFDSCVSYDQFMYWDHSFLKGSDEETDYLLAAIGQANASITPAGLHFCTNALLNHGTLAEPIWIKEKKTSPEGEWISVVNGKTYPKCSPKVADQVVGMMQQVTERGTGVSFYLPGFAAKTGTAQKSDETGNLTDRYTVWTTGGLVSEETPYSITVCLDNVTGDVGSAEAGRLAQDILTYMLEGEE